MEVNGDSIQDVFCAKWLWNLHTDMELELRRELKANVTCKTAWEKTKGKNDSTYEDDGIKLINPRNHY